MTSTEHNNLQLNTTAIITPTKTFPRLGAGPTGPDEIELNDRGLKRFSYPVPHWLASSAREHLLEMAKAALILLCFDRTQSGCWAKTYMFRRKAGKSGQPLAGGSLTGTAMAINGITSALENPLVLRDWLVKPLQEKLASILMEDGRYLGTREFRAMGWVIVPEPLRHVAGALLAKLILDAYGPQDLKTVSVLSTDTIEPLGWDRAMVARTLSHSAAFMSLSNTVKTRCIARVHNLLRELCAVKGSAALIWADPSAWTIDVASQWGTVWAILPYVSSVFACGKFRPILATILRQLLLSQAHAAEDDKTLLPNAIDATGKGQGRYVFGTSMAILAWRTLELYDVETPDTEQARIHCRGIIQRILHGESEILEIPSFRPDEPLAIEGYLGWIGILLAAASIGVRLEDAFTMRAISLVAELETVNDSGDDQHEIYVSLLRCSGLLNPETVPAVARSLVRVAKL